MLFVKFHRYFKVIFEELSDKREMELRRANNVDDEEESMHLEQDLEVVEVDSKGEMEEMKKESSKIKYFHFA